MPIPVQCACGRQFNVPDKLSGKSARCLYCGKAIPVPEPGAASEAEAPPITVECACGKKLKAPARLAGQSAKCPGCGAILSVPMEAQAVVDETLDEGFPEPGAAEPDASPGAAEPEPQAREERVLQSPWSRKGLPGWATALAILGLLDAAAVGFLGVASLIAAGLLAAAAQKIEAQTKSSPEAPAEAFVQNVKERGGNITLNQDVISEGQWYRRIEYVTASGEPRKEMVLLGSAADRPGTGEAREAATEVKGLKEIAVGLGIPLVLVAAGKIVCSIGFFLRRNWGRAGLAGLAAFELFLVGVGVLAGGGPVVLLPSVALNAVLAFGCLSMSVRAACDR